MMKRFRLRIFIFSVFLLVFAAPGPAEDFRCGGDIISIGARRSEVLRKCGEPANIEAWEEVRYRSSLGIRPVLPDEDLARPLLIKELVTVEEWEYNLGPGKFIRYLRFENGRLVRITTGDYGD